MHRRTRVFVGGLAVCTALAALSCSDDGGGPPPDSGVVDAALHDSGGDAPSGSTVTSDDGKATLTIPSGALPAGTKISDITITAVTQAEAFKELDANSTFIAAFRLEPAGLKFSPPATLEVQATLPTNAWIVSTLVDANGVETPETRLTTDAEGRVRGYSVDVAHFSGLVTVGMQGASDGKNTGTALVEAPLRPTIPGGPTGMSVQVLPVLFGDYRPAYRFSGGFAGAGGDVTLTGVFTWQTNAWTLEGYFFNYSPADLTLGDPEFDGNLNPHNPRQPTALAIYAGTLSTTLDQPFTCKHEGEMTATYRGDVSVVAQAVWTNVASGKQYDTDVRLRGLVTPATSTAPCVVPPSTDPLGDFIDSIKARQATFKAQSIDITAWQASTATCTQGQCDATYNRSIYACGKTQGPVTTVCLPGAKDMPAGDVHTFTMSLAADVPLADTTHSYIYSLVLDSDDDPTNDWQFVPPFDFDIFQGTDRWYQLIWSHKAKIWSLTATQVDGTQKQTPIAASTVRAIIAGKTVTFHVSASEFGSTSPGYRLTAFGHDGSFSENDRGADVTGADPTAPLSRIK